jgi:hypothetical protein
MHFVFFSEPIDLSDYLRLALAFLTFNHGYGTGSRGIWGKEFFTTTAVCYDRHCDFDLLSSFQPKPDGLLPSQTWGSLERAALVIRHKEESSVQSSQSLLEVSCLRTAVIGSDFQTSYCIGNYRQPRSRTCARTNAIFLSPTSTHHKEIIRIQPGFGFHRSLARILPPNRRGGVQLISNLQITTALQHF